MPPPELTVKNLKVAFNSNGDELVAVNGISYEVYSGETLAIVGESGCGKTVSALSILRLISEPPGKILDGQILFGTHDLLRLNRKTLRDLRGRDISMIFQDPMTSLNPVLTVGEQIIETLLRHTDMNRGQANSKALDLLRKVDIPSPEQKLLQYPHQLSGGMRQRVMIAMALSCSPRILIADEPTTALDVLVQAQLLDLLDQIKEETGMSILLITHDLGIVAEIAQRVLVMYAGEIVESGQVSEVFQSPLHPYTRGLMNSVPRLHAPEGTSRKLDAIEGQVPSLNKLPTGCPFHPRCPEATDHCRSEKPDLRPVAEGRAVNCWLHI